MSAAREVLESFLAALTANDWEAAAAHLAPGTAVDWPCSGERIPTPEAYAEVQRRYPSAGPWRFEVRRIVAEGRWAVAELEVTDGERAARAIFLSEVEGGRIVTQVEYWPVAYEPEPWRADLVERIPSVP